MYKILILMSLFGSHLGNSNVEIESSLDDRIMGGVETDISDHPYQVSLEYSEMHLCGGAIINKYWVVTTGICLRKRDIKLLIIRAGTSTREADGTVHNISLMVTHPQFDSRKSDYDVAVIKVSEPFVYSNNVKPIPLANVEPTSGTPVIVTGWGRLDEYEITYTLQLREVKVYVISRSECRRRYGSSKITERMMCAGVTGGGKDACRGDLGGPLVAKRNLVGLVSWVWFCGDDYYPTIYTNIALLKKWIDSVTNENEQRVFDKFTIVF